MPTYDAKKFLQYLNGKWAGRPCSQCGASAWQVQDSIFELRGFSGGSLVLGGPIVPLIPVTCSNCGNTVLINAILAGAIEQPVEVKK
jgi:hypothetical protein